MKKLKLHIFKLLIFCLFLTFCLPGGILGIIFGAINKNVLLLVCGIVMTVAGFYCMPFAWVNFGSYISLKPIMEIIENDNIYSTVEIANQLGKKESIVCNKIRKLISKRFLTGYIFKNNKILVLNSYEKQSEEIKETKKCPNCGGIMKLNGLTFVCEYCKHSERKQI